MKLSNNNTNTNVKSNKETKVGMFDPNKFYKYYSDSYDEDDEIEDMIEKIMEMEQEEEDKDEYPGWTGDKEEEYEELYIKPIKERAIEFEIELNF